MNTICTVDLSTLSGVFVFDPTAFGYAFAGGLTVFAAGVGIGLLISLIRKLRVP